MSSNCSNYLISEGMITVDDRNLTLNSFIQYFGCHFVNGIYSSNQSLNSHMLDPNKCLCDDERQFFFAIPCLRILNDAEEDKVRRQKRDSCSCHGPHAKSCSLHLSVGGNGEDVEFKKWQMSRYDVYHLKNVNMVSCNLLANVSNIFGRR